MVMRAVLRIPDPVPQPEPQVAVSSTEGHGTWTLSETETRQLYQALGQELETLDRMREAGNPDVAPPGQERKRS